MNKELKKLPKKLKKLYWKNKQRLYVSTPYIHDKKMYGLDVYATLETGSICDKESIFLFSIQSLDCFVDSIEVPHEDSFRKIKFKDKWKQSPDYATIAHTPFYMKELFTLKRFGTITEKDIEGCTRYFVDKVLDMFLIFNIKVLIEYDKPKKKGLDLSEMKNYDGSPISTNPGNHEEN